MRGSEQIASSERACKGCNDRYGSVHEFSQTAYTLCSFLPEK